MGGTTAGTAKRERCPNPRCRSFAHPGKECPRKGQKPKPLMERLWAKVDTRGPDECWPWTGTCTERGYGQIDKQYVGRILLGLDVGDPRQQRHTCDNPPCCNPAHLVVGTSQENSDDMVQRGRSNRGVRHWNVRLTPEQVAEIRASAESSTRMAEQYGVSAGTIRKIRQRIRWK